MSPDGTGSRRVYRGSSDDPAWSPDGRTILFWKPGSGIVAMARDGRGVHTVIRQGPATTDHFYIVFGPAWSPDGKLFAYLRRDLFALTNGTRIWTANRDGSGQHAVATIASIPEYGPTWSPDSSRIAFADFRNRQQGVFAVERDGGIELTVCLPCGLGGALGYLSRFFGSLERRLQFNRLRLKPRIELRQFLSASHGGTTGRLFHSQLATLLFRFAPLSQIARYFGEAE